MVGSFATMAMTKPKRPPDSVLPPDRPRHRHAVSFRMPLKPFLHLLLIDERHTQYRLRHFKKFAVTLKVFPSPLGYRGPGVGAAAIRGRASEATT